MSLSATIQSILDIMRMFLKTWDDPKQELELIEHDFVSPLISVTWQDSHTAAAVHHLDPR